MKDEFKKTIGFVSLGCDKNRVDTEKVISLLKRFPQFEFVSKKEDAEIVFVNTCAFLQEARDEAKSVIEEMSLLKKTAKLQKLFVLGCLPLLKKDDVKQQFPAVDEILLPKDYGNVAKIVFDSFGEKLPKNSNNVSKFERFVTTPAHYAYLKIADGCNNRCAFCKIPYIRGNYVSYDQQELVEEAKLLCERGAKELILVAQDVTRYGCDKRYEQNIVSLLQELSKIKKLSWIRLLYCYPDQMTDELVDEIATNHKVVKYVDIPLQHASDHVLNLMNRHSTKQQIEDLISKLRTRIPNIKIRSTFMVGFPGETKKDFDELCRFLKQQKLDNVGFFKYSREEGTSSYDLEQVSEKTKDERLKKVQLLQQKIAEKNNRALIGSTLKVLCDSFDKDHKFFVGRPYFCAPDIDFEVLFTATFPVKVGSFVDVEIEDYDKGYFVGKANVRAANV